MNPEGGPRSAPTPKYDPVRVKNGKIIGRGGKKLPEFFADNTLRVRIDSIASYEKVSASEINVLQKSGVAVQLNFEVSYLTNIAISQLDVHFNVERPEAYACSVCANKGVQDPESSYKRTMCDFCYADKRKNFKEPEAS